MSHTVDVYSADPPVYHLWWADISKTSACEYHGMVHQGRVKMSSLCNINVATHCTEYVFLPKKALMNTETILIL